MNIETMNGIFTEIVGRVNERWGELSSNPWRAAEGHRARIAGEARQRNGIAKEQSARQLREFLRRHRHWHF